MLSKLKELESKEEEYLASLNEFLNEVKSSEYLLSKKRIIKSCDLMISNIDYLSEKIGKNYKRNIWKLDNSRYSTDGKYIKEGYLICFDGKINMYYYKGNHNNVYYFNQQILDKFSYEDLIYVMKNLVRLYQFLAEEYYYIKFYAESSLNKIENIEVVE